MQIKTIFSLLFLTIVSLILTSGCENIFSKNVFHTYKRDPEKMDIEQQIHFAEFALNSNSTQDIKTAYKILKMNSSLLSPAQTILFSNLAIRVSGLPSLINDVIKMAVFSDPPDSSEIYGTINTFLEDHKEDQQAKEALENAYDSIKTIDSDASASVTITSDQYVMASLAKLIDIVYENFPSSLDIQKISTVANQQKNDALNLMQKGIDAAKQESGAREVISKIKDYFTGAVQEQYK